MKPPPPLSWQLFLEKLQMSFARLRETARKTRTVEPFTYDPIHSDVCVCVLLTIYAFTVYMCTHSFGVQCLAVECNALLYGLILPSYFATRR